MTPLEKAISEEGKVNYCDECEQFKIVGNYAYCKVDGKLIHPIMLTRGQGTGPAWNCHKRSKKKTNFDLVRNMNEEDLAVMISLPYLASPPWCSKHRTCPYISEDPTPCYKCALEWLRSEAE